jgi:hypothetical protein
MHEHDTPPCATSISCADCGLCAASVRQLEESTRRLEEATQRSREAREGRRRRELERIEELSSDDEDAIDDEAWETFLVAHPELNDLDTATA